MAEFEKALEVQQAMNVMMANTRRDYGTFLGLDGVIACSTPSSCKTGSANVTVGALRSKPMGAVAYNYNLQSTSAEDFICEHVAHVETTLPACVLATRH